MKKLLLCAAFVAFGMGMTNAQDGGFAAGIKAVVPMGDFADFSSFGIGAEVLYLHPVSDKFTLGGSVGYTTLFTDDIEILGSTFEIDDVAFLPIVVKAMYSLGDSGFGLGADIGYAVGINEGNDGGLLYEPKLVFSTDMLLFSVGYQGVSNDGDSLESIQIGAAYKF
ncbi:MAG: hypothetical protein ACJAXY_002198 [Nonlabens sp.]|jgi:hypothetical protein|uniref:hypothetical protein n=1 Tax=Nonlabens sp. TaxID=1888209 RepID=UPI0039E24CA4